jgi:hypothetical protein
MKHDPYFKYLALVIIAGVLLAIADPTPTVDPAATAPVAIIVANH